MNAQALIVLATRNPHKAQEFRTMLPSNLRSLTLADLDNVPSIEENADSFAGNAELKARGLLDWLAGERLQEFRDQGIGTLYVLADDSGLEVDALDGAPGVHSARFAAEETAGNASDQANNAKLLRALEGVVPAERTARFRCVLALAKLAAASKLEPEVLFFNGVCEGQIGLAPRGTDGFGYDPLFLPEGSSRIFAELGAEEKNRISHRSRALAKLATQVWP